MPLQLRSMPLFANTASTGCRSRAYPGWTEIYPQVLVIKHISRDESRASQRRLLVRETRAEAQLYVGGGVR